jgi:hypothetical protein
VAPEDPIHLFTYAQTLLAIEGESRAAEGDGIFQRALQLAPVGELAEKIKAQQRQLAAPPPSGKLSPVLLTTRGLEEMTSAALQRGCQS